jgi:hypothetical protein
METLIATTQVSDDGKLVLKAPESFNGAKVRVKYSLQKEEDDDVPRDKNGWPIGFWESIAADPITDPNFKRYPQGEAEPPPSFE